LVGFADGFMHILVYYGIDILGCGALFYLLRLGKVFNKVVFISPFGIVYLPIQKIKIKIKTIALTHLFL
jgi:hypothetical protein